MRSLPYTDAQSRYGLMQKKNENS